MNASGTATCGWAASWRSSAGPAVADAIGNPANALTKLTSEQPDDAKLVDDIFLRVLNRSATEAEIKKTLDAWATISPENAALLAEWEAKEKEQAPIIAKAEADRLANIDSAKKELARYEAEIAPRVAAAEKKRVTDLAAAQAAIKDYETKNLAAAEQNFEATVPAARTYTGWTLLDLADPKATSGVQLKKMPDGSVEASGPRPRSTDYTLLAETKLAGITGILLETLPVPDQPAYGPGRSTDGNFVLGEFAVKTGRARRRDARRRAEARRGLFSIQSAKLRSRQGDRRKKGRRQQRLGRVGPDTRTAIRRIQV